MLTFQVSPLFRETYIEKIRNNSVVASKFDQFIKSKTANPNQNFGSNDKPFRSGGFFTNAVPKIRHAHLTHDISVVYTVEPESVIRLYGLFSHDDMGTGTPANINRQKSLSSQFSRQTFGGEEVLDKISAGQKPAVPKEIPKKVKPTGRSDFTPKFRSPNTPSRLDTAVDMADIAWEQRNFKTRWNQALTKNDKLSIINSELQYLQLIARKNRLYPGQEEYARQLIEIYNLLTDKK
jgi:mRNA-degrading endonuclease YafQ of YafQ-DinJ toxin-antitoxin module